MERSEIYRLHYKVALIRATESAVKHLFDTKQIGGTVHLSIGQESVDAALMVAHNDNCHVFGNHRSHGQWIASTEDVAGLFEQLRAGMSQHLYRSDMFTATGTQGTLVPVAFGSAMATNRRTLAIIGDGTMGEGIIYETMGLCLQYRDVPFTLVVIDNGYSMSQTDSRPNVWDIAQAFKLRYIALEMYQTAESMVDELRQFYRDLKPRRQPVLIHAQVRRMVGHSCNDTEVYRPKVEKTDKWRKQYDPMVLNKIAIGVSRKAASDVQVAMDEVFGKGVLADGITV